MLVVATDVSQASNDKLQLAPTLDKITDLPAMLGARQADSGYFNEAKVKLSIDAGIAPLIATGRSQAPAALSHASAR